MATAKKTSGKGRTMLEKVCAAVSGMIDGAKNMVSGDKRAPKPEPEPKPVERAPSKPAAAKKITAKKVAKKSGAKRR